MSRRLATSLVFIAAAGTACVTRERVIIVKESPSENKPRPESATNDPPTMTVGDKVRSTETDGDSSDSEWGIKTPTDREEYARVVGKVATMVNDSDLARRVQRRNLSLVNVAWEDTGRAVGSSIGPNISDLSLQVRRSNRNGGFESSIMPVIRPPNFVDRTGDIPADRFFVRVGNEHGQSLRSLPLIDVLKDLRAYASKPDSIGGSGNVFAARDSHFLVSAQAVFLPIPRSGKAQFNPVVFNYQSAPGAPAVLTILVTRQGTSMQVIENQSEDATAAGWGQELYFNNKAQRAPFTAERKSDVVERIEAQGGPRDEDDKTAIQKGADVLFLIQVPLKHAQRRHHGIGATSDSAGSLGGYASAPSAAAAPKGQAMKPSKSSEAYESSRASSDVEQAVLGHGPNVGPFNEGHRLTLERDAAFPIRVTVQFYKATSNGIVSDIDLDGLSKSIGGVYEHADAVGSLVMPDGDPRRPTAWQRVPHGWFPW